MMNPGWRRQPGRSNGLFLKIDHYCGGFERKMKRVGSILTKLSFDKDFKVWTGFVSLRRLLGF